MQCARMRIFFYDDIYGKFLKLIDENNLVLVVVYYDYTILGVSRYINDKKYRYITPLV